MKIVLVTSILNENDRLQDDIDKLKSEKKQIKIELDAACELNTKSKEELVEMGEKKDKLAEEIVLVRYSKTRQIIGRY